MIVNYGALVIINNNFAKIILNDVISVIRSVILRATDMAEEFF